MPVRKKKKKYQETPEPEYVPPKVDDSLVGQSLDQKKMAFANSAHVDVVITILQECGGVSGLIGETEYKTVVNAVTLDAQQEMLKKFINSIDAIRKGSLFNKP